MKNTVFFMLIFMICNSLASQENCTYTLSGSVIDEHDSSRLAFASIIILNEYRGTTADANGHYVLENLCPKNYTIVISHLGCESDTVSVTLKGNRELNFFLEHHSEELKEVIVQGEKANTGMNKQRLTKQDLIENSGKPLGDILSAVNGVNTYKTGSNVAKPVINGFKNNRIQIVNQGINLQSQQWGNEHAPEIDPFAASKYSVIKGASSVKYAGGVMGGLILIEPNPLPRKAGIGGELNTVYASNNRLQNYSLLLEGNSKFIPAFSWRIQGSYKKSGNIKTPHYYQKNTGVMELNGSADFAYYAKKWNARFFYSQFNSEIGIFSGAHIGNLSDLRRAIASEGPRLEDQEGFSYKIRRPKQNIIHELAKAELNYYSGNWGSINIKIARQFNIREEFDKELPRNQYLASLNIPEFSVNLESYSTAIHWSLPTIGNWESSFGLSSIQQENKLNSFTDFIPDYSNRTYSAYLIENWSKNNTVIEFGFRADQNELAANKRINREFQSIGKQFTTITMNLGAEYKWKNHVFKSNLSFTERPPAINELLSSGLHHGTASLEFGQVDLKPEKSSAIDFSYQFVKKIFTYDIYAYIRHVEDFIYLNPTGLDLSIRGAFPSFTWAHTDALIRGFDQSMSLQLTEKIKLQNELSFIWGDNLEANNFLINMPSNAVRSEVFYALATKRQKNKFLASFGNRYVFQQKRYNPEQEIVAPPQSYSLFQVGLSWQNQLTKKQIIQISLKVENLMDTVYRDYLNQFRFYTDEQGRNILIRIHYKF